MKRFLLLVVFAVCLLPFICLAQKKKGSENSDSVRADKVTGRAIYKDRNTGKCFYIMPQGMGYRRVYVECNP
jgi:hypothetical protein